MSNPDQSRNSVHPESSNPANTQGDFALDEAVVEFMPKGTTVELSENYGRSRFTSTGRVSVILPNGIRERFFLKSADGEEGHIMLLGEYTSMKIIDSVIPGMVPSALGWGKYSDPGLERYFLLSNFLELNTSPVDPQKLADRVAELHRKGESPNGMFGFPVVTYNGALAHTVAWEKNWTTFFTTMLKVGLDYDKRENGYWPELEVVAEKIIEKVIPRLLGIIQSNGRQIKPSLLHGDLWSGNLGTDRKTGNIVFYDVGSYYGHNEMELGSWRCPWSQKPSDAKLYTRHYLERFPAAEPAEEFDDRNRLYSLKFNLGYSGGHPGSIVRQTVYQDMGYLCEKYATS